jgi:hypothetical protein
MRYTSVARCWRVIRKDERTKHLDELIMEGEETRLEASSAFESTKAT